MQFWISGDSQLGGNWRCGQGKVGEGESIANDHLTALHRKQDQKTWVRLDAGVKFAALAAGIDSRRKILEKLTIVIASRK